MEEKQDKIVKNSLIVSGIICVGKVLGFVKQSVLAWAFGANAMTDVYFSADGFASALGLMMDHSIAPSVLTQYVKTEETQGSERAREVVQSCYMAFAVVGIVLSMLVAAFSESISAVLGLSYTPEQRQQLRFFLVALCPIIAMMSIAGVSQGYLLAKRRFVAPKLSGMFFSVSIILFVLLLKDVLGLYSLLIGFLTGYALYTIFIITLVSKQVPFSPSNPLKNPEFKSVLKKFFPIVLSTSIVDIGHILGRMIASSLSEGSVSELYYGQVISSDMVNAVVVSSVGAVLLPSLTQRVARNESGEKFVQRVCSIMGVMIWISGLLTMLYSVEGADLICFFFERGGFTAENTRNVAKIATCYSVGFIFMVCRDIFTKCFYAFQDTMTPLIISTIGVVLNLSMAFCFSRVWGAAGIALGASMSFIIVALLSGMGLRKHVSVPVVNKELVVTVVKTLVSMIVVLALGKMAAAILAQTHFFVRMLLVGMGMVIVYLAVGVCLRIPAIMSVTGLLRGKKKSA